MAGTDSLERFLRFGEGRRTKRMQEQAAYIATLEPEFQALSDAELRAKTAEFRQRLDNGEELDNLLFEAYAAVREARVRESDQRMFDVQMMGGIVLHEGDVAEMKTGEGKTFVASLALYLNALPTVDDPRRPHARPGRPPRHGQRLPRPARRRVEPRRLRAARDEGRVHRDDDVVRGAQGRLRGRHHLRHELRVRLRLPARQHGDLARGRPSSAATRTRSWTRSTRS